MKKLNTNLVVIIALAFLTLFFLNQILHKDAILDNVHYINDLTFVSYNTKEALENNELPLWTPYFYSGHPLLAIPENYMLDMNFLMVFLFKSVYFAMNFALVFYFFLAGIGMYLLINNAVESKKAAFVSAIIYMFNGLMHSFIITGHINILEGYALIPFIFLFAHKALKSRDWIFYSILAGIFFALQILSGSMIFFFYTALLVSFYFAFSLASRNFAKILLKAIFAGLIMAVVALSLSAVKLLPVLEFTKMSSRAVNVSFNEFLGYPIGLKGIIGTIVTNLGYSEISAAIGIAAFILLVFGILDFKKRMVLFFAAVILFSLLFASGTFVADIMYKIPGFDKLRHVERALVLFAFAASALAGYGFVFLSEKLKKYQFYLKHENLFFIAIIAFILLELLLLQNVPQSAKIIMPNDIKLLEHMGNDNSTFRTINLAQKDIIGAAGYNYYSQNGISEAKGGGGIWVNDYAAFLSIAQQALSPKMLGILNVKYAVSDKKLEKENLTLVERFNSCRECAVWNAFGPYLYENRLFLPRFYVAPNSILVVGHNNLARQIVYNFMLQNFEPENTVLITGTKINDYGIEFLKRFDIIFLVKDSVDQNSIGKLREYAANGGKIVPDILNGQLNVDNEEIIEIFNETEGNYTEIGISQYSSNRVVLNLDGEKGWLVASERFAYFPGWLARVNGKLADMSKADNAITALYLDGEKGELVFEYKPGSYGKGKVISLIAFIFILIYVGYFVYTKKFGSGGSNQI
ncbi:hypothetical protein HYX07_02810 [Candidatus Woesearchaeota archaeon]|nr:hypothetical protein [Candidatus Woesearchaeota archaeon]